jgi:Phospholipase_D-nuclease N-terminal/Short C-terminal domain
MISAADDDYPLVDLITTLVLFFALMLYFWLLITAFGDLVRRHDLSGWGKAGWIVLIVVLPLVGALAYLIVQGQEMAERDARQAAATRRSTDDYIRSVAAPGYQGIEEIARAKDLLDRGAISQDEFEQLKGRALV